MAVWSEPKTWEDDKVVTEGHMDQYIGANTKHLYEQFNLHKVEIDDSDISAHGADDAFGSHVMLAVAGNYTGTGAAQEIETNIHVHLVFIYSTTDNEFWVLPEGIAGSAHHADGGVHAMETEVLLKGADLSVFQVGQNSGDEANLNGQTYYYVAYGYGE